MVLYAESGVGKTSVMAKVYKLIPEWFGEVSVQFIRFAIYIFLTQRHCPREIPQKL